MRSEVKVFWATVKILYVSDLETLRNAAPTWDRRVHFEPEELTVLQGRHSPLRSLSHRRHLIFCL